MEETTWIVRRLADDTFTLQMDADNAPVLKARDEVELIKLLYPNGVRDELQESVLQQLRQGDAAVVKVPISRFSQGLPR